MLIIWRTSTKTGSQANNPSTAFLCSGRAAVCHTSPVSPAGACWAPRQAMGNTDGPPPGASIHTRERRTPGHVRTWQTFGKLSEKRDSSHFLRQVSWRHSHLTPAEMLTQCMLRVRVSFSSLNLPCYRTEHVDMLTTETLEYLKPKCSI